MSASAARLELWLGSPVPAPAPVAITEKLQRAEITCNADGPNAFQLQFNADRTSGTDPDFSLLSSGLLDPWTRVLLGVTLDGGTFTVLMDGFITHQEMTHERTFAGATLTVTGEDVSILMDRVEYSLEYPEMGDSAIALAVLAKYEMIGILPEVAATPADLVPLAVERTPQQSGTDRAYLRQLAAPYGFRFTVTPGPSPLTSVAHWGPSMNTGAVAPPLSMDDGGSSNVEKLSFKRDALAPVVVYGVVQDDETEEDAPLATFASTRAPPLSEHPVLDAFGLLQRRDMFTDPRLGYFEALVEAQARTDVSTDRAVTCDGEVDTLRYGAVIATPGLIDVRGAGTSYDGRYRVESVTHRLARGSYSQSFSLAREGVGSTIARVSP